MAIHLRAALSSRSVHRFLLVGSQRNFADRFLLGRLAWTHANVWILPHLRRQNGNVRCAHAAARFRNVRDLVRHCGGAFAISPERYTGHLLPVWRAVYSANSGATWTRADSTRGRRRFRLVCRAFLPALDNRQSTQPREGSFADHEHRVLVVLQ